MIYVRTRALKGSIPGGQDGGIMEVFMEEEAQGKL